MVKQLGRTMKTLLLEREGLVSVWFILLKPGCFFLYLKTLLNFPGVVRKAKLNGKMVAVKTLELQKYISDKEKRDSLLSIAASFVGEARKMASFKHRAIVEFLGFIMENISIVMEFMNLGALNE